MAGLSLKIRLVIGIGISMLPLLAVIGVSHVVFNDLLRILEDVAEEVIEEVGPVVELADDLEQVEDLVHAGVWHPDQYDSRAFHDLAALIDQAFVRAAGLPFARDAEISGVRNSQLHWTAARERWLKLESGRFDEQAKVKVGDEAVASLREAVAELEQVREISLTEVAIGREEEIRWRESFNFFLPVVLLLAVGMAFAIAGTLIKAIIRPVRALERGAHKLAEGELSYRVGEVSRDELGDLARTFDLMAEKLEQNHRKLEGLSSLDYLTGLANVREFYRLFHEEIQRAERYQHPFSLIVLDVDTFKEVNDSYGHQIGDQVLQGVGRKLRELVRNIDHVARIGGDEFAILFPETDRPQARDLAERIRSFFAGHRIEELSQPPGSLQVTISLGLATFPIDADQSKDLFALADQALYRAKQQGRNRLCVADRSAPDMPSPHSPKYH